MSTLRITFPFRPENVDVTTVQRLFAAGNLPVTISRVQVQGCVVLLEVSRPLTLSEIATAKTTFAAAYPRIENV